MQSHRNSETEVLLERERRQVESLEERQKELMAQLEALSRREVEFREETTRLEKTLTMLKHDLKEVTVH